MSGSGTDSPARLAVATERLRMTITEPTPVSPSGPTAHFRSTELTRAVDDLEGDPTGLALDALSVDDAPPSDDDSWTFELQSSAASDASSDGGPDDARPHLGELASAAKERVLAFLSPKPRSPGTERTLESLATAGLVGAAAARPATASRNSATYVRIENRTSCPVMLAEWPTKLKGPQGGARFRLSHYRGNHFDQASFPSDKGHISDSDFVLASMKQRDFLSRQTSRGPRAGWVYFDLIQPSGYLLHLQIFVALAPPNSSSTCDQIVAALLGRFDLDSTARHPMPSGQFSLGQIDTGRPGVITFVLDEALKKERNKVDDSTKKPLPILPRKGLVATSFASHPRVCISLLAGKDGRYHEAQLGEFEGDQEDGDTEKESVRQTEHLLNGMKKTSASLWVQHRGDMLFSRSVFIYPLLGIVKDADKRLPLASTSDTGTRFFEGHGVTLSFGFHDSGLGRRHFMYVYATRDHSAWLGELVADDERWLQVPFSRLVLAGSHDAGMYTSLHPGFIDLLLHDRLKAALGKAALDVGLPMVRTLFKLLSKFRIKPELAICNMSNTQKDTISDQLRIGTRFFDFRPGYCFHDVVDGFKRELYHQHAVVPGAKYVPALQAVLLFLAQHEREIVVIELKSDGFLLKEHTWRSDSVPVYSMQPTKHELALAVGEARSLVASDPVASIIQVGGAEDLDRPIGELLEERTRLLIVDRMRGDEGEVEWERDDSYDHEVYDTDEPEKIVSALQTTHARNVERHGDEHAASRQGPGKAPLPGCIYQLQATPTKSVSDDIAASLTYSKASSLLVYTKAKVDPHTYCWVKATRFVEPGLVVLLNDFVDPLMTEIGIEKSRQRAGLFRH